ncbi:MAG: hypothetical protein V8S69_07120 [Dakarella massiliensis]
MKVIASPRAFRLKPTATRSDSETLDCGDRGRLAVAMAQPVLREETRHVVNDEQRDGRFVAFNVHDDLILFKVQLDNSAIRSIP